MLTPPSTGSAMPEGSSGMLGREDQFATDPCIQILGYYATDTDGQDWYWIEPIGGCTLPAVDSGTTATGDVQIYNPANNTGDGSTQVTTGVFFKDGYLTIWPKRGGSFRIHWGIIAGLIAVIILIIWFKVRK